MAKINPATKAVEESEEGDMNTDTSESEESVDELLATYEEVKDHSEKTRSQHDVKDRLPSTAKLEDGTLWQTDNSNQRDYRVSLTDTRKQILYHYARTGDVMETRSEADVTDSYVRTTVSDFEFILEDPALFEAFVLSSRAVGEQWRVSTDDGEAIVGAESAAFRLARKRYVDKGEVVDVISPDGEVHEVVNKPGSKWEATEESNTLDQLEQDLDERIEEKKSDSDSSDLNISVTSTDDDVQESVSSAESNAENDNVSLPPSEAKRTVAALYRDGQDELADDIIDRLRQ